MRQRDNDSHEGRHAENERNGTYARATMKWHIFKDMHLSLCLSHMTQVLSRVCPGVGKIDSTYFPSPQPVFLKLQHESESPGGLV